jgi:hypothetical protein
MKNLIGMTDFVLSQRIKGINDNVRRFWACERYANFLKRPLELWMFVPCDEEGNVLVDDNSFECCGRCVDGIDECVSEQREKYQQAKERCLFEGFFNTIESPQYKMYIENGTQAVFYIARNSSVVKNIYGIRAIEDLIKDTPVELTETAKKLIGL